MGDLVDKQLQNYSVSLDEKINKVVYELATEEIAIIEKSVKQRCNNEYI